MSSFRGSNLAAAAALVAAALAAAPAGATVKHEGTWPDADKPVTLDVTATPRTEALRKLADAAGWSLVVHAPPGDPVEIHVKNTPASKVLDVLLDDGDYVVSRDGNLVSVKAGEAEGTAAPAAPPAPPPPAAAAAAGSVPPAPPVAAVPAVPPIPAAPAPSNHSVSIKIDSDGSEIDEPHGRGQDRTVMGGNVTIAKGEVARDVTVFGGNVDMLGKSTGDVTVFGGNVEVHEGALIHGDATVFGGTLTLDKGAKIDGDVSAIGGTLKRDPDSIVGGDVTAKGSSDPNGAHEEEHRSIVARAGESVMDGVRLAAVLFVIGTVLLALSGRRMDMLRAEVATRPMRSLALGVLGVIGSIVTVVALCVTVIGIPVAIVALLVAGFALLGGMCAVLSVVGEGLLRHRTENPYVHLAVGCAIYAALAALPWVGGFVVAATVLAAIGVLVATRGAGLVRRRNGNGGGTASYPPAASVA
jgi:lipopolysaccharide export system protein LptA